MIRQFLTNWRKYNKVKCKTMPNPVWRIRSQDGRKAQFNAGSITASQLQVLCVHMGFKQTLWFPLIRKNNPYVWRSVWMCVHGALQRARVSLRVCSHLRQYSHSKHSGLLLKNTNKQIQIDYQKCGHKGKARSEIWKIKTSIKTKGLG